jgi:hypothetical protein
MERSVDIGLSEKPTEPIKVFGSVAAANQFNVTLISANEARKLLAALPVRVRWDVVDR